MSKSFLPYGGKPSEPQESERRSTECMAHGCPLPGVFSSQMRGNNFVCRAHDGIAAESWPAVTDRVRKRERALFAAIDLTNALSRSDPDERIVAAFVKAYGEKFARQTKRYGMQGQLVGVRGVQPETARDYGQRVYGLFLDQVRGESGKSLVQP